jgi:predicted DNA-binding protein (MmcQ/YjbR family)
MNIEWIRQFCLSLPHVTEQIQWGNDLLFKVGGKMFAAVPLEPARIWLTFKCTPEDFAELTERPGIIPAPYLARAKWVAVEKEEALSREEILRLVKNSYEMVFAKLTRKVQAELRSGGMKKHKAAVKKTSPSKRKKAGRKNRRRD